MEPDDRPFILKWSRTWPDDPNKRDFIGRDPSLPDMFARTYLAEGHPDRARAWFWTASDGYRQIDSGHAESTRAAARAAEAAYIASHAGEQKRRGPPPRRLSRRCNAARLLDEPFRLTLEVGGSMLVRQSLSLLIVSVGCGMAFGQPAAANCFSIDPKADKPLAADTLPPTHACHARMSHGLPIPDPTCSPGASNPTITIQILRTATQPPASGFRTSCVRDKATSAHAKAATYVWYGVPHPSPNTGASQTCELDHIVSLELGGADTLDNIWPECGPPGVALHDRYFKQKDLVENYLADQVRAGAMTLRAAQRGIATDWTKYLAAAKGGGGTIPAGANP